MLATLSQLDIWHFNVWTAETIENRVWPTYFHNLFLRPSWPWSYGTLDIQIPVQSVPINNKVVSSNPAHGDVYSIQIYMIEVCQWLATGWWFSPGTPVSSSNKTDHHDINEILLKVALNTIAPSHLFLLHKILTDLMMKPYNIGTYIFFYWPLNTCN